jgi:hypothetical protein
VCPLEAKEVLTIVFNSLFKCTVGSVCSRRGDCLAQVFPAPAVRGGEFRVQMASGVFELRIAHSTITVSKTVVASEFVGP